ncbi:MAG: hypothetical protein JWM63_3881 [Gammaproteobacteria bacterium]|nr:hypothetical protein [Gammaproteobacteria bacterium]
MRAYYSNPCRLVRGAGQLDESRFFTGVRPSEQVARVMLNFAPARGTLTVNKARVAGVDKDSAKTCAPQLIGTAADQSIAETV